MKTRRWKNKKRERKRSSALNYCMHLCMTLLWDSFFFAFRSTAAFEFLHFDDCVLLLYAFTSRNCSNWIFHIWKKINENKIKYKEVMKRVSERVCGHTTIQIFNIFSSYFFHRYHHKQWEENKLHHSERKWLGRINIESDSKKVLIIELVFFLVK